MTDPRKINLKDLREQAQQDLEYQQIGGLDTSYPLGVLALIDTAEAATAVDLDEVTNGLGWVISEGADSEATHATYETIGRLRETLNRYTTGKQP